MRGALTLSRLYPTTLCLLAAHQIDSAYWQEWTLFGMPGGIQCFVLLNLLLLAVFVHGHSLVLRGSRAGTLLALLLAAAGLFAFVFHGYHLLRGTPQFQNPTSVAILVLTSMVSLTQAIVCVPALGHPLHPDTTITGRSL